jgi:HAE1 family hydrophobic/amphiphilic exporter-1/multidrug efflux pump
VEYALLKFQEGLSPAAAALEAARLRFRPILMTSLAFILGVLPLAISSGAGAGARHSVGTGVMGGMLAATFLAIFFIPMFFKLMSGGGLGERRTGDQLREEIEHHRRLMQEAIDRPHHAIRPNPA